MPDPEAMIRLGAMLAGTVVAVLLATLLPAGAALAACTDPPAHEVNWQRCILDGLELEGVDLSGARLRDGSFFRSNLRIPYWKDSMEPRSKRRPRICKRNFGGSQTFVNKRSNLVAVGGLARWF